MQQESAAVPTTQHSGIAHLSIPRRVAGWIKKSCYERDRLHCLAEALHDRQAAVKAQQESATHTGSERQTECIC